MWELAPLFRQWFELRCLVGIRYAIALPYPRVRWIVSFQYQDQNGEVQEMTVGVGQGQYNEDLSSQPARLTPPFGQMWPVARVITNAVQVDYATGYGGNITIGMTASSGADGRDKPSSRKMRVWLASRSGAAGATAGATLHQRSVPHRRGGQRHCGE